MAIDLISDSSRAESCDDSTLWIAVRLPESQCETLMSSTERSTSISFETLIMSFFCNATAVTLTKRMDCNLLRKETSFVYYTSSVLRKNLHMKKKIKLRTVAKI